MIDQITTFLSFELLDSSGFMPAVFLVFWPALLFPASIAMTGKAKKRGLAMVALIRILVTSPASADVLAVPNEFANKPGEGSQGEAFDTDGIRWLNIYDSSQFLARMPEGGQITKISFRVDENQRGTFTEFIPEIELRMSTSSSLAPDVPFPFSEHVGTDETIVFPRGSVGFTITPSDSGPNPFLISFPLRRPFNYDPRQGSLALDMRTYQGATQHGLVMDTTGSSIAFALVGSITDPIVRTYRGALILELEFTAVPEPATLVLLLPALCTVMRKKKISSLVAMSLALIVLPDTRLQAAGQALIVPNEFANVPAEGAVNAFALSSRFLNVYNPSEFLSAMPEGGEINQISFRIDESDRDMFTSVVPDIEIRMSTSPSLAPDLPVPFADNIGQDEKVVFPRGSVQFTVDSSASGPNPFAITFPLKHSFTFDPRKGGLAVDFWIYEQPTTHSLLFDATGHDSLALAGSMFDPRSRATLGAMVLQVQFSPVPEPSILTLTAVAAVFCLMNTKRGRQ